MQQARNVAVSALSVVVAVATSLSAIVLVGGTDPAGATTTSYTMTCTVRGVGALAFSGTETTGSLPTTVGTGSPVTLTGYGLHLVLPKSVATLFEGKVASGTLQTSVVASGAAPAKRTVAIPFSVTVPLTVPTSGVPVTATASISPFTAQSTSGTLVLKTPAVDKMENLTIAGTDLGTAPCTNSPAPLTIASAHVVAPSIAVSTAGPYEIPAGGTGTRILEVTGAGWLPALTAGTLSWSGGGGSDTDTGNFSVSASGVLTGAVPLSSAEETSGTFPFTLTLSASDTTENAVVSVPITMVTSSPSPSAPLAPTGVVATGHDGSANVGWTAPTSDGSAITGYTVRAYPSAQCTVDLCAGAPGATATATATAATVTVTGLTVGAVYSFVVTASNGIGESPASGPSAAVRAGTAPPAAPSGVTAAAGAGSVVASWQAPTDRGSTITSYSVDAFPSGSCTATTCSGSPVATTSVSPQLASAAGSLAAAVTGLTDGVSYSVVVIATNGVGASPRSVPSGAVVPVTTPAPPTAQASVDAADAIATFHAMQSYLFYPAQDLYQGGDNLFGALWTFTNAVAATEDVVGLSGSSTTAAGTAAIIAPTIADDMTGLLHYQDIHEVAPTGAAQPPAFQSAVPSPLGIGGYTYYDDNAWVALDLLHAYRQTGNASYLSQAEGVFTFLESGWSSTSSGPCPGGIYWIDSSTGRSRNTVSNGPSAEAAVELYQLTGNATYLTWAKKIYQWVRGCLVNASGMYYDHVEPDGTVTRTLWSYNQGTMMGAGVLLYQATGSVTYLDQALQTARASVSYYGNGTSTSQPLYSQDTPFNSIYFRNLLLLNALEPNPAFVGEAQNYVDTAQKDYRDATTGIFNFSGVFPSLGLVNSTAPIVTIEALLAGSDPTGSGLPTQITSAASTTFTVGVPGDFQVTTAGNPPPTSITESGALPAGVSFVDNHNGTATLVGTPAAGSARTYAVTLTASGAGTATQRFTLSVSAGPEPSLSPLHPVVAMAPAPGGDGYWMVNTLGQATSEGRAGYYGSMGGQALNAPIVGMAAATTGKGYWEVAADGGIFAFGSAPFAGSMGGQALNAPIVGMAAAPTGKGYWEVAADGGIFAFGSAPFAGS
ncbi:MAG: glycoside hydrolase family 76 protein, partial [Acidimicrobiales bacterium]